jgi:hypothetical protein
MNDNILPVNNCKAKDSAGAGCMVQLVNREKTLRQELKTILNPKRGDIYANEFGTSFMLINGKKALRMTTDKSPDVRHCLKTWIDVTEDPYMSKVATVNTVLSSLGLIANSQDH